MRLLGWLRPRHETVYVPVDQVIRREIDHRTRAAVWDMTGGRCWWCGVVTNPFSDFQVDHIVSLKRGGPDTIDNMAPSCAACNLAKRDRDRADWEHSIPGGAWYLHQRHATDRRRAAIAKLRLETP